MTGFLLDTNALLIFAFEPGRTSQAHRDAFDEGDRYVSQVCAMEIAVKFSVGKLPLPPPFQTDFTRAFKDMVSRLSADILDDPDADRHIA